MIMMAVTAKAVAVAVKTVMTAPMIGRLTDLNAVILPGMNMVLTVQRSKVHMAGIVPAVAAPVTMVAAAAVVTAATAI
jgi:hypothetical protein